MVTVTDYKNAQTRTRASIATLQRELREAYDAAQATTTDGRYDCLDKLVNDADRDTFKSTLMTRLTTSLQASINALPEDPLIAETLQMNGFYGFTKEEVAGYINAAKDKTSFDGYMEFLEKQTRLGDVLQVRAKAPFGLLDQVPTADVVNYVGITPVDQTKIALKDKAELIDQFDKLGIVPPKYLVGKPYM